MAFQQDQNFSKQSPTYRDRKVRASIQEEGRFAAAFTVGLSSPPLVSKLLNYLLASVCWLVGSFERQRQQYRDDCYGYS